MTKMMLIGNQAFKFNIWDTAGQERVSTNSDLLQYKKILLTIWEGIYCLWLERHCSFSNPLHNLPAETNEW